MRVAYPSYMRPVCDILLPWGVGFKATVRVTFTQRRDAKKAARDYHAKESNTRARPVHERHEPHRQDGAAGKSAIGLAGQHRQFLIAILIAQRYHHPSAWPQLSQ